MTEKPLVVLGSVNADHILKVESFPRPGETVSGHGYRVVAGGKGANQAVAAARLGAKAAFIACVGDDDFGSRMVDAFASEGIDTQAVMQVEKVPTGVAIIYVSQTGENSIGISPESNACLTPERLVPHLGLIKGASALLMQLETPMETLEMAAAKAKESGVPVILNPAPARPLSDALLNGLSMITPNETEAEVLTGVKVTDASSAEKAAKKLHTKGVKTVVITLGSKGAFASTGAESQMVSGYPVKAVDTTAAGDTFNGGLAAALQKGAPLSKALAFANAAAALSVTGEGAQPSIPTLEKTRALLEKSV